MGAYVKREGGKSFGNKPSFGARSGKPSFAKKPWGDKASLSGPKTFYKATCSNCGNSCDVPFKPVNGKPVFCRNCFVKTGDTEKNGRAGDRYQKREYTPRSYEHTPPQNMNIDIAKQLEEINSKLERLIRVIEASKQA